LPVKLIHQVQAQKVGLGNSWNTWMDVTETELETLLAELDDDNFNFRYDPIDSIVQAINSIHLHEP